MWKIEITLKCIRKKTTNERTDIKSLFDVNIRQQTQKSLTNKIRKINENTTELMQQKNKIETICTALLKYNLMKKKYSMTDEILAMMEERRKNINKTVSNYWEINRRIRAKIESIISETR